MDKNDFSNAFFSASCEMDMDKRLAIERDSIDPNPVYAGYGTRNLIIMMEECSELIQILVSAQTGLCDRISLIEEVSDVEQGLDFVKIACELSDKDIYGVEIDLPETTLLSNKRLDTTENAFYVLSGLQQQLSKYIRGKSNREALIESVRDTYILINRIKYTYDIPQYSINKAINVKLKRLEEHAKKTDKQPYA